MRLFLTLLSFTFVSCGIFKEDDSGLDFSDSGLVGTWTYRAQSGEESDSPTWGFQNEEFDGDSEKWTGKLIKFGGSLDNPCSVQYQGTYSADGTNVYLDWGDGSTSLDYEVGTWESGGRMLNLIDDGSPNYYFQGADCD